MTFPLDPRLIGVDETNRLRQLALQRAQVLRREAITDAWRLANAAFQATLAGFRRCALRLTGRHGQVLESRPTAVNTPKKSSPS